MWSVQPPPLLPNASSLSRRYDGRGHLHDLSEYDAGSWNHAYRLSEEEARIEALCDEERYLALHTDLLEEEARQGTSPFSTVPSTEYNRSVAGALWVSEVITRAASPPA